MATIKEQTQGEEQSITQLPVGREEQLQEQRTMFFIPWNKV